MNDYRIFVGAFPEGDLADRIQVVRARHERILRLLEKRRAKEAARVASPSP